MAWNPSEKEIQAVLKLAAAERYSYWIKKAADREIVWSLGDDTGWALAGDSTGQQLIPLWPHEGFAQRCAEGAWQHFAPKSIELGVLMERWLPGLQRDNRLVAVFPNQFDKGVPVTPERLKQDLLVELDNYE